MTPGVARAADVFQAVIVATRVTLVVRLRLN
jgi:hypothetical protein